jgi:hypothetical protein
VSAISLLLYALLVGRNWLQWHGAYDDPESSLSHRLATVTTMIRDHVDTAPSGGIRCVWLCTGECRDLTDALAGHPRARDLTGVIIELDPVLAARAKTRITEANLDL